MNPLEVASEHEEHKFPCPNIVVNELDNPSIIIPTVTIVPPLSTKARVYNFFRYLNQNVSRSCDFLSKCFKSLCLSIRRHALSMYFLFNTILLLALISKLIIYPKVVYFWIGSSCFLLLTKAAEFLQSYRVNNMRSFELLDRLENQIRLTRARNVVRRAASHNPFLENLFRNEQNLMNVLNIHDQNNLGRFPEYNTVFNNILRLRVHVLAMRMNLMMHALGVFPEDQANAANFNQNHGLNQSQLDDLESQVYVKKEEKEEQECIICLEIVKEGEEIRELECRHTFHKICIDKWLVLQRFCPYCRTVV